MIITLIFLVLYMHIRAIKLLEDGALNAKFDVDGRLHPRSTSLDQDNNTKIKKAITINKNNKDKEEKKNRQLKRKK